MKKIIISLSALATSAIALSAYASPQFTYPTKPIRLVIGFPAGGGADNTARLYGDALSRELGQPVIVDNKPGAGTTIAAEFVAKAPPDGYTLYIGTASVMGGDKVLYKNIKYEPADFSPITRLVSAPLVLAVSKQSDIHSVAQLINRARTTPGALNYSSSGNGVLTHLAAVQFCKLASVRMTHVPYKGGAPSAQALAAGDVQLTFATAPSLKSMIDAGRVLPLAVTSAQRSLANPDYPTVAESGVKGFDVSVWYGLFAPAKTPVEVIEKLFIATEKVMSTPELKKKFLAGGDEVSVSGSVAEFKDYAAREGKLNTELVISSGAAID